MSVAKWLGLLTWNHLPSTAVGLNSALDFGFFHVRKLSIQLTECWWFYLDCLCVSGVMHGGAKNKKNSVQLSQVKLQAQFRPNFIGVIISDPRCAYHWHATLNCRIKWLPELKLEKKLSGLHWFQNLENAIYVSTFILKNHAVVHP